MRCLLFRVASLLFYLEIYCPPPCPFFLHPPPPAAADVTFKSLEEATKKMATIKISSPSKLGSSSLLRPELAHISFVEPIVTASNLSPAAFANIVAAERGVAEQCKSLVQEGQLYAVATAFVPSWVTARPRDACAKANAAALFGPKENILLPERVVLPWLCEPESFTSTSELHSSFFTELKSVSEAIFNQIMTYGVFSLARSYFHVDGGDTSRRRFYKRPLVGYGLVSFAHCGYLVALEWVGKVFMTPISDPFVLGSRLHESAVESLVDHHQTDFVEIDAASMCAWRGWPNVGEPLVLWCVSPINGCFYKIMDCAVFDKVGGAARLRTLRATYVAYAEARTSATTVPKALVPAELLYGAFELAVKMPFVGTRTVEESVLAAGGAVLDAVVPAIVWLARHGLLYVDLRGRNVVIDSEGGYCLVDYDDMVILPEPAQSAEELLRLLRADPTGSTVLDNISSLQEKIEFYFCSSIS